ncbi:MAG: iron ABC transporter permease [Pseudomonadota bacterium]
MIDSAGTGGRQAVLFLLAMLLFAAVALAICVGAISLPFLGIVGLAEKTPMQSVVLEQIRLPRVVLAAIAGGALAVAGGALQAMFRNPLADPGLIGVSGGAAVGAIGMIVLGAGVFSDSLLPYLIPLAAVSGAALVTALLFVFAKWFGSFEISTMLLVGIALNSIATVAIGAFEFLSDDTQLRTLVFWMMGSFGRATWATVLPAAVVIILASVMLLFQGRALDILQLGEAEARNLSVDVNRLKRVTIVGAAAGVGGAVAVSGIIAFIGLIVPHIVRLVIGPSNRWVLPASLMLGATLSVLADLLARTIIVPAELPVGLVTSAIGGPFFLWLIARVRRVA